MRALVFGASAGLGRCLARELAAKGYDLTLLSRDDQDIRAEAAHCETVYRVQVDCIAIDACDPEQLSRLLGSYVRGIPHQYRVLAFPIGGTIEPDPATSETSSIAAILNANLTGLLCALSLLLPHLEHGKPCTIVGFGSIAGARGRSKNVAYSAAKRGLKSYFESLRHTLSERQVLVQFYQLGYVATQQTFGRKLTLPAADPAWVAKKVVAHLNDDFGSCHLPRYWALVTFCLRALPWRLFKRLEF